MAEPLERCLAFLRALEERLSDRRVPFPLGAALFHERLPLVWDLNQLHVDDPGEATTAVLVAEAERLHREAGHTHRKLALYDEGAGRRLEPELAALGWEKEALLVMVHRRKADRPTDTAPVREVEEAELQAVRERGMRSEPWGTDDEAVRQILAAQFLLDGATTVRRFAAFADGGPVSYCDLYSNGRTAQVETVMTLEEYRGRGLARAVVTRALEEARADGNDFVFLVADPDDWPKELYRRLGFDAVGLQYRFQLTLKTVVDRLLAATGASRVTLRRDVPGDVFLPVVHEARAEGVPSIADGAGVDLRGQPVVRLLEETGEPVVQDDSAAAFPGDSAFERMRAAYGGLGAQIVTPILAGGRLVGVLSLHHLGGPRTWTAEEKTSAAAAAAQAGALLGA